MKVSSEMFDYDINDLFLNFECDKCADGSITLNAVSGEWECDSCGYSYGEGVIHITPNNVLQDK